MDKILFVDDEANILSAFERQFRKQYEVMTRMGAEEGLRAVATEGPFAVVVSDFRMPEVDGIRFLSAVKTVAPHTVRMMLTGHADVNMATEAVNEGMIFRFLTKPCPPDDLARALTAAVRQYKLVTAERELLENTLRGSINVLTEILGLVNAEAFGRCSRIRNRVRKIGRQMELPNLWQVETAALLSQLGCVILPEQILKKCYLNDPLSEEESQLFSMHPQVGSGLIAQIPHMEEVAEIVKYQEKHYDGTGFPIDSRSGDAIPVAARILKICLDLDILESEGMSKEKALSALRERKGWYDPQILAALVTLLHMERESAIRLVTIDDLEVGMVLAEDVLSEKDLLLVSKGQEVSLAMVLRLQQFARTSIVKEPFRVIVPGTASEEPKAAHRM